MSKKFELKWTNSKGVACSRSFDVIHDRTLFANRLYLEKYDQYGKISISRPVGKKLEDAIAWAKSM